MALHQKEQRSKAAVILHATKFSETLSPTNSINMEAEERPAKMQKVEHGVELPEAEFVSDHRVANSGPANINDHEDMEYLSSKSQLQDNSPGNDEHRQDGGSDLKRQVNSATAGASDSSAPLSKSQLKKIKRQQEWEAGREDRKARRKEKIKAKKERKKTEYQENQSLEKDGISGNPQNPAQRPKKTRASPAIQLPISIIFDCNFDDLMMENEMKSLASQLTRCYSDNRNAHLRAHLAVASFGGKLKERFDNVLAKHYESWKGIEFFAEDFVVVAEKAKEWMKREDGGRLAGTLEERNGSESADNNTGRDGEVVYLSSESDVTLEELKPYGTYIIGGLVDKNRHKGICYKRATGCGVKTAKLPIGDFLEMNSRSVLATNHVSEIMLKWLALGDWGEAFIQVIPKRKGGKLRGAGSTVSDIQNKGSLEGDRETDSDDEDNGGGVSLLGYNEYEVPSASKHDEFNIPQESSSVSNNGDS
jgi:tRNA (guanine9-N1)-methyltransferase